VEKLNMFKKVKVGLEMAKPNGFFFGG